MFSNRSCQTRINGYGTKRPKDIPFWDSAKGQLVKKAGNDLLTTGSFALGLLLPFGKLKILKTLSRVLNGAAIADFVTSDRVTMILKMENMVKLL